MSDIKYAIRKLEFSHWAKEALLRIENLIAGRNVPLTKHIELANELIREFVFCECDRRGSRRTAGLTAVQELGLLDSLCEYLSGPLTETARNTIFLSLFGGADGPRRTRALCRLTSMAVSAGQAPVLLAVSIWLQQTSCSSPLSLRLARSLVRDYFILHPANDGPLRRLPEIAPQFVANFTATAAEMYLKENPDRCFTPPPERLLEIITDWVTSDARTCLSAQLNPTYLPTGGIPMVAVSPLTGLIQWCALAPLYIFEQNDPDVEITDRTGPPAKKIKIEKPSEKTKANPAKRPSELELYGRLHLGILQSLHEARRPQTASPIINAQHLAQMVAPISQRIAQVRKSEDIPDVEAKVETCLNRLAQATQIALAGGCVFGNIASLLSTLETLPENRMLRIVIKTHLKLS